MEQYHEILRPLSVYADYAARLKAEAEALTLTTELACGHEIDDSVLDTLQDILCNTAELISTALHDKLADLPSDIDEDMLRAYGLSH